MQLIHFNKKPHFMPRVMEQPGIGKGAPHVVENRAAGEEPLSENLWGFCPWMWRKIQSEFNLVSLYAAIAGCYREISGLVTEYRSYIETSKRIDALYQRIQALASHVNPNGTYTIDPSRIERINNGISGSYFLRDEMGQIHFVIKPIDEDGGCINNPKDFATPYLNEDFIRENITLYRSSLREALTYEIAQMIGVEKIAPKTVLALIESDQFFQHLERVSPQERERYLAFCEEQRKEKLCSVQEFVPDAMPLFQAMQHLQSLGLSSSEIQSRFDRTDYEEANLLIWMTGDTDAHAGNILIYPKGVNSEGHEILGIKKIDNGLAYPGTNGQLRNALAFLPHANQPISDMLKEKIAQINTKAIAERMNALGMEESVDAMMQRVDSLKKLANQEGITARQINEALLDL